jgi:hypothetical protein
MAAAYTRRLYLAVTPLHEINTKQLAQDNIQGILTEGGEAQLQSTSSFVLQKKFSTQEGANLI